MNLRRRVEDDLARDIQEHIELATRENIERGMAPAEARFAALRKFGNVGRVTEETYAVWHWVALDRLRQDVRYALRGLRRNPGFTTIAILTLALGIGINTAVFSVLNAVIFEALPYPDAGRLMFVWERMPSMPAPIGPRLPVSYRNFAEWRQQSTSFEAMEAFCQVKLDQPGGARQISTGFTSAGLFALLGTAPRMGRLFTAAEERKEERVAVLSDTGFDRRFHRDPGVLGRTITLGETTYTVIGVLPARFRMPAYNEGDVQIDPEVWAPLSRIINHGIADTATALWVPARLQRGVSLQRARSEMTDIAARLAKGDPQHNKGLGASVFSFAQEDASPKVHRALYVLMGAVGFLLLIACANLANLTLARATLRAREIAVRLALGASRGRIVAQLMTEALAVSAAGAVAGLVLAQWSLRLMLALKPGGIHNPEKIAIDARVLLFAVASTVGTALLVGLAPAVAALRSDLNTALKSGGKWGGSALRLRSRQALIVLETAMALVLVTGAGLMIRSFAELLAVGIGFDTTRLTYADLDLPKRRYPDGATQVRFYRDLLGRAGSISGVRAAAVVDSAPLHRVGIANFSIVGRPEPSPDSRLMADVAHASPGYFGTIGLHLLAGRNFTEADLPSPADERAGVAIVNRAFARQFFGGRNPLGERLRQDDQFSSKIVGVVSDYRAMGTENGERPTIFWPDLRLAHATLLVRGAASTDTLAATIRDVVWAVDRGLPAAEVHPMQYYVDEWLSQRKFLTLLLVIFAGLALALGLMGIYGVLANAVTARTREIGIRMAIGATPAGLGWMVLRQGMTPVAMGLALGLAASLALGGLLDTLLFQVDARDPLTLATAACAILIFAPLAIALPLRRATQVDANIALREE